MRFRGLVVDDLGVLRPVPGRPVGAGGVAAVVRAARAAGLRTAVLSNADVVDVAADFGGLVDVVCVSGVTGRRKPDPAAFVDCARRLGVPAEACLFVDDAAANVRGAVAAGMTGVLHRSDEETVAEVEALLATG